MHFNDPGNLLKPAHFLYRQVSHLSTTDKWQHAVFAQGIQLNIRDDNHVIHITIKYDVIRTYLIIPHVFSYAGVVLDEDIVRRIA
jgi:hypothetical protein